VGLRVLHGSYACGVDLGLEPIAAEEWRRVEAAAVAASFDDRWRAFELAYGRLMPLVRVWLQSRFVVLLSDASSPVAAMDRAFRELGLLVAEAED
jgi:hypothetical protein